MAKIKWIKPSQSSFVESKQTYIANIGGVKGLGGISATLYFDQTYPFVWKLSCAKLDISKLPLRDSYEKSKQEAHKVIKDTLKKEIRYYKVILSKIK